MFEMVVVEIASIIHLAMKLLVCLSPAIPLKTVSETASLVYQVHFT